MSKKNFFIPQIEEDEKEEIVQKEEKKFKPEEFVSSISGHNVKNKDVFPYVQYGNKGYQYESLREKRLISDEELKAKYGSKYHEFVQISQTKEMIQENRIPDYLRREDQTVTKKDTKPPVQSSYSQQEEATYDLDELPPLDDDFSEFYDEENYDPKDFTSPPKKLEPLDNEEVINDENVENSKKIVNVSRKEDISRLHPISRKRGYLAPPITFLKRGHIKHDGDYSSVQHQRTIIDRTLDEFRIGGKVVHFTKGPAVTQFEVKLDGGVKVEKVKGLARNFQMNLQCKSIRIEAPIPGKSTVGLEVPNPIQDVVYFGELLTKPEFLQDGNPLNVVLGLDISGNPVYLDIGSMPHALIAGTTGSGKSVCINSIITSIIYKADPSDVKLILIDPKIIEFSNYEDLPHLAAPVINDSKLATISLKWAVEEMERRYILFRSCKRKDIAGYNEYAKNTKEVGKIPYIVIIIDEMADLMSISANSVEEYIQRIAQKARAAGIHLIMATQRPSTDIIKGTIKANIQTRIAFAVNSQVDSMTILDRSGAEKLLGKGDMLYSDGVNDLRLQGAYISEKEIAQITEYLNTHYHPDFMFTAEELKEKLNDEENERLDPREDEYFNVVAEYVVETQTASINKIQKKFGIGFNRAQSIMEGLEQLGIVSESLGSRPRNVLVKMDELESILEG